jgi:hypothetical protein
VVVDSVVAVSFVSVIADTSMLFESSVSWFIEWGLLEEAVAATAGVLDVTRRMVKRTASTLEAAFSFIMVVR